jgi:hypothetical protein
VKYPLKWPSVVEMAMGMDWAEAYLGTLSYTRSWLNRVGAVSGLNLGASAADGSGTVQADVASLGGLGGKVFWQEVIAECFQ